MDPDKITIIELYDDRRRRVQQELDLYMKVISDIAVLNTDCRDMGRRKEQLDLAIFELFKVKALLVQTRNDFGGKAT